MMERIGIYVHIPYCVKRCLYCDFYTAGARQADWVHYADRLLEEWINRRNEWESAIRTPYTIYIGGGTPSLMPIEHLQRLTDKLKTDMGGNPVEFTIEVNPEDVTRERARAWRELGANRVSMGIQTLVDDELRKIGRRHTAARALEAYSALRSEFDNISLDVMFGLPGQTPESLERTLDGILDLRPEHLSAYSLMYEERTAITVLRNEGRLAETDEDDMDTMFRIVGEKTAAAGYEHYEISNYALPGRRSRHNSLYWAGVPYIGLGPAASSYDGARTRRTNNADIHAYNSTEYGPRSYEAETLTDEQQREEMIMTRLRRIEGLDVNEYRDKFGERETRDLLRRAEPLIRDGALLRLPAIEKETPQRFAIPAERFAVSDDIIVSLF